MSHQDEPEGQKEMWRDIVARFARFSGLVAEIDDPLTWGLDLTEETVAGGSASDPTDERFLRSYTSPWRDLVDVETLRSPAQGDGQAAEFARMGLCSALAAPHHPADMESDEFLDSYADYRRAMREIVTVTEETPLMRATFIVDGAPHPCLSVTASAATAVYTTLADRALIIAGPAELVDQLTIVMRPIRNLLHGDDGPRF